MSSLIQQQQQDQHTRTPSDSGATTPKPYKVWSYDNFQYVEGDTYEEGEFATAAEAIARCKRVVDEFLLTEHKSGESAEDLYCTFGCFGFVPCITSPEPVAWEPWEYAKHRCQVICEAAAELH